MSLYPSLAFYPPTEYVLSATAQAYPALSRALLKAELASLGFLSLQRIPEWGAHFPGVFLPRTFRFQGLVTLLTACFSQLLWPISQSQALLGFALQSVHQPTEPGSSQNLCSLTVWQSGQHHSCKLCLSFLLRLRSFAPGEQPHSPTDGLDLAGSPSSPGLCYL